MTSAGHHVMLGGQSRPYLKRVEYLEATGTQGFDTGIPFISDVGFSVDFLCLDDAYGVYPAIIGVTSTDAETFREIYEDGGSVFVESYVNGEDEWQFGLSQSHSRAIVDVNFLGDMRYQNSQPGSQVTILPYFTSIPSMKIGLFCVGNEIGGIQDFIKARIFRCQISRGANIVRDYQPVVDLNGVACMYDAIANANIYNQGTGSFIAGPDL